MLNIKFIPKIVSVLAGSMLLTACATGGLGNYGATPFGGNTGFGGGNTNTAMGVLQVAVINAIIQNMGGNVLNGQIGSQLSSTDQNFRLQQLGSMLLNGNVNQAQQWQNPQTGNSIALNPIGQANFNPQNQQQCRQLEETVTTKTGQRIQETRLACLNPQTGKWNLVQ